MKVKDLIEFLEYSDRNAQVVLGVVGDDGCVRTRDDVLLLNHGDRVCLVFEPETESIEEPQTTEIIRLAEFERKQLFGHNFVLLRKPPVHRT